MTRINRRELLRQAAGGIALAGGASLLGCAHGNATESATTTTKRERPPALGSDLVREFVSVSHRDLPAVTQMLETEPKLVNATWDWGGGDFETGLGAAAHTGGREIALLLLDRGARLDIFAAAMLGRLEVVQAALAAFPEALHTPGPHGIPLIVHARVGGEPAADVLAFLTDLT